MRKIIRIIALSLCALFCFPLISCTQEDKELVKATFQGTHIYTAPETNQNFISSGKTDYMVVIPEGSDSLITTARDELIYFFQKATNITLQSTSEENLSNYSGKKYISIGETQLLANSGMEINRQKLGNDGHNIYTGDDGNIYLIGGSDYGSLYAVYTFLDLTFNFESYYADCYEIDTGIKNMKLKDYQVTDIPDFKERGLGYGIYANGDTYDISNFRYRMRMPKQRGSNLMPIFDEYDNPSASSATSTNGDWYFPYDVYNNPDKQDTYHPYWFSTACASGRYQFCYTARGDANEYRAMVEECAKKIENSLVIFPRATYGTKYTAVSMTTQDNQNVCKCQQCLNDEAKYGYGGIVARFINDVGEVVEEWMKQPENEPYKREDFRIIFFAYLDYSEPPTVYNEKKGEFEPIDGSVRLRDNVGVYLAPMRNFAYERSVYDKINNVGRDVVDGWASLTDCIYLWTYSTNFNAYMFISDTYSMYNSEGYQYFASKNVEMIVNQGQTNNPYSTAWHSLKMYLDAKLQWDCNLDTQTLTDNWFRAMYGEAANAMQDLFAEQIAYTRKVMDDAGYYSAGSGTADNGVKEARHWPLATLESWVNKFDDAKALLNKNNPKYQMYADHIEWEVLSPLYITLYLYGSNTSKLSTATKNAYKARLSEDINYFGISRMLVQETGGVLIGNVL